MDPGSKGAHHDICSNNKPRYTTCTETFKFSDNLKSLSNTRRWKGLVIHFTILCSCDSSLHVSPSSLVSKTPSTQKWPPWSTSPAPAGVNSTVLQWVFKYSDFYGNYNCVLCLCKSMDNICLILCCIGNTENIAYYVIGAQLTSNKHTKTCESLPRVDRSTRNRDMLYSS